MSDSAYTILIAEDDDSIRHGLIDQGLPALWCPKEIIPLEHIPVLPSGCLLYTSRCV